MNDTVGYNQETNIAVICGNVIEDKQISHKTYGEIFYVFKLGILRNSGYEDQIIIMASERIMNGINIAIGEQIKVYGQIRTYNENVDGHNKLNIVVFAREILEGKVENERVNEIYLEGYLCKQPQQRTSPLGRKICDLMLAVNRMYNKSDYIPSIAWGRNAVFASSLQVGDKIAIHGRLQSRQYKKKNENGEGIKKIAYEVSVLQLETLPSPVV